MDGERKKWRGLGIISLHPPPHRLKGISLFLFHCAPLPGGLVNGYRYSDLYVRSTLLRPCDHRFCIFGYLQKGNRRMGTSGSFPLAGSLSLKGKKAMLYGCIARPNNGPYPKFRATSYVICWHCQIAMRAMVHTRTASDSQYPPQPQGRACLGSGPASSVRST